MHPSPLVAHQNLKKKARILLELFLCFCLLLSGLMDFHHNTGVVVKAYEEENSYSVTNLLPAFKTLLFWRTEHGPTVDNVDSLPLKIEDVPKSDQIEYQVNDGERINNKKKDGFASVSPVIDVLELTPEKPVNLLMNDRNILDFTSGAVPARNSHKPNRLCHGCSARERMFVDESEEYRQRIEYIKQQILNKLGLKEPPRFQSHPDLDLINMYMAENSKRDQHHFDDYGHRNLRNNNNNDLDFFDEDVEIAYILPKRRDLKSPVFDLSTVTNQNSEKVIKSIIVLTKYNITSKQRSQNYLNIDDDLTDLTIASVPNMIEVKRRYGMDDFSLISIVTAIKRMAGTKTMATALVDNMKKNHVEPYHQQQQQQHQQPPPSQQSKQDDSDSGHTFSTSYEYDVTNLLKDHNGMIRIYNENFDIQSSFIKIEMTNNKFIRTKRSVDCTETVSFCCRQAFYVNFTTIGWNNWILQPSGYNANYCKGKCDLSHARYHHTTVIGKYPVIKLCCSPREMSSISLIYMDVDYNIYQKNLPNMVVESCDCA